MPRLTQEWIDRLRWRAENTWGAETASGWVVVAHPNQKVEDSPKVLRENYGLMPGTKIERLIDSKHAPPIDKWQAMFDEQDLDLDDQIEATQIRLAELEAQKAKPARPAGKGRPPAAPPAE